MSNNILGLIIDTSFDDLCIALTEKHLLLHSLCYQKEKKNFTATFFQDLQQLLQDTKCQLEALSYIAVGKGPGSYTGIRIGTTIAQSLAYSLQIPLISFCSLQSYIPKKLGPFYAGICAKKRGLYLLEAEKKHTNITFAKEPFFLLFHELEKKLAKNLPLVTPHKEKIEKITNAFTIEKTERNLRYLSNFCYKQYLQKNYCKDYQVNIFYPNVAL